jgi:hypothetical protein
MELVNGMTLVDSTLLYTRKTGLIKRTHSASALIIRLFLTGFRSNKESTRNRGWNVMEKIDICM